MDALLASTELRTGCCGAFQPAEHTVRVRSEMSSPRNTQACEDRNAELEKKACGSDCGASQPAAVTVRGATGCSPRRVSGGALQPAETARELRRRNHRLLEKDRFAVEAVVEGPHVFIPAG